MKRLLLMNLLALGCATKMNAQCSGNEPVVYLGADTTLCAGQTLSLNAANGYDNYLWSTLESSSSITVNSPGTYFVEAIMMTGNANLVVNGDFEAGNTGFNSSYGYVATASSTALWNPGFYAVGTSPNNYHSNFYSCTDHTSGSGKMYIANGASTPNTTIWSQTITVQPNTNYHFSAWVSSVENTTSPAIMQFFVNGSQIGNVFSPSLTGCQWDEFYNLWNSGSSTSAVISIVNQNTTAAGNDFAIDDISFIPICTNYDTIVVDFDTISVDAGIDLDFCSYSPESLNATSNYPNAAYEWSTNETTSAIIPTVTGQYSVSATSENGCVATDQVEVTIYQAPTALFSATPSTGIVPLNVVFTNQSQNAVGYQWDFGNGLTQVTNDLSDVSTLYALNGSYHVVLVASDANGCLDTSLVTVVVTDPVALETANVFTPNKDGVNDIYQFNMVNITEIDLHILNRWGGEVCLITDPTKGWSGTDLDGNDVPDGVYFYRYTAKSSQGENFEGQGFIHLIRN